MFFQTIPRELGAVEHAIQCALILTSEVDRYVSNIYKMFGHVLSMSVWHIFAKMAEIRLPYGKKRSYPKYDELYMVG